MGVHGGIEWVYMVGVHGGHGCTWRHWMGVHGDIGWVCMTHMGNSMGVCDGGHWIGVH